MKMPKIIYRNKESIDIHAAKQVMIVCNNNTMRSPIK